MKLEDVFYIFMTLSVVAFAAPIVLIVIGWAFDLPWLIDFAANHLPMKNRH